MSTFTKDQSQALRQLAELWRDNKFCLIGASALPCQIDLPRKTGDLDRPLERERDLHDLAHILENHVPPDDERRFATEVLDAGMVYEHASADLSGHDVGQLVNDTDERPSMTSFHASVMSAILRPRREGWSIGAVFVEPGPR